MGVFPAGECMCADLPGHCGLSYIVAAARAYPTLVQLGEQGCYAKVCGDERWVCGGARARESNDLGRKR